MLLSQGLAEQAVAVRSAVVRVQLVVLTPQSERPLMKLPPLTQNHCQEMGGQGDRVSFQ